MTERDDECELGYWLGKEFWGQGLMGEIRIGHTNVMTRERWKTLPEQSD